MEFTIHCTQAQYCCDRPVRLSVSPMSIYHKTAKPDEQIGVHSLASGTLFPYFLRPGKCLKMVLVLENHGNGVERP